MSAALPVLMYHHVTPAPGLVTVSPPVFRRHMEYLVRKGWTTLGAAGVEDFFAGRPVPRRSVVITFDDGYLDNYVYAWPVLREFGLTATIFLVTGWTGEGPTRAVAGEAAAPSCPDHRSCKQAIRDGRADDVMLRWSEVERMREGGICEFQSHTHSHRRWDKETADRAERRRSLTDDLALSGDALRRRLGVEPRHLCWPQGYFDEDYLDVAQAAGYTHCYTTRKTVNRVGGDPLRIGRIVAKEASPQWLGRRLAWFSSPLLGGLYSRWRGE
jgi:peptidoglycan/xylan/chitin deacetylase (PgdA/CDA1 family)